MRFSDEVTIGERTYQIDVRRGDTAAGTPYEVTITDGVDDGAHLAGQAVAGELTSLATAVYRTMLGLAQLTGEAAPSARESAQARERRRAQLDAMRQEHPNAGMPWAADDDARLVEAFRAGADLRPLAGELGRRPSALVSRLRSKGLIDLVESRAIQDRWRREASGDANGPPDSIEPRFVASGPFT